MTAVNAWQHPSPLAPCDLSNVPDDELLTTAEVCLLLRVSRTTVWALAASGRLPAIRIGHRTVRYRRVDIDELCATGAASVDPDVLARLAEQRRMATGVANPCSRCGQREADTADELGRCCHCIDQRERELAGKRDWWARNGKAWRDARKAKQRAVSERNEEVAGG